MILRKPYQMNDRIRQLSNQAYDELVNQTGNIVVVDEDFQQRFAQLIVKECVGILMTPEYPMNHPEELADYNRGWVNGRLLGIEHIEGYFGVEQ
jgi:hypothetical protein